MKGAPWNSRISIQNGKSKQIICLNLHWISICNFERWSVVDLCVLFYSDWSINCLLASFACHFIIICSKSNTIPSCHRYIQGFFFFCNFVPKINWTFRQDNPFKRFSFGLFSNRCCGTTDAFCQSETWIEVKGLKVIVIICNSNNFGR